MIDDVLYNRVSFPPYVESSLSRPRIDSLLEKAIQKPLTTVIAGAGYGKTQAVSAYLESTQSKAIWFQLSELDNLITRFWERAVYGFKSYSPDLSRSLKALGYPETIAAFNNFLHLIAKTIAAKPPLIIVFDDFHLIYDKAILNFLENLIVARIQNLSIVLISRTKPNLNVAGMLSNRLLGRITEDDLRFMQDEMKAYYELHDLHLDESAISNIYYQTEGWILAAYLVCLSMKKEHAHELHSMRLVKIDIFELIDKEIFAAASEKLQHLLLKFAILDIIPKALLAELSEHNDAVLLEMTQISLLMRYDASSDTYRIHHLFKEFLLERKNNLTDEQIAQIHRVAASWYEKNNCKLEAINHYTKCHDCGKIFDIILTIERRVAQEVADSLIKLIEEAPKDLIEAKPVMQVVKAHYLMNNNRIDKAHEVLTHLRAQYEGLPSTAETRSVLGEVYIVLALISIIDQNLEFEALFVMADACLPHGSALVDHQMNIADGLNICGIKSPQAGELNKYKDAMLRAMPFASRVMNGCCHGAQYLNAADSFYMSGDIRSAERSAFEAIFCARQKQQHGIECMANFILVRIYVLRGDYDKASALLKAMKGQLDSLQIADSLADYDIIEGWFHVKIGEPGKVANWIKYEEETRKLLPPVTLGREFLVRSDGLLAEGRYNELLAYMDTTDVLYAQRGILYAVIQNKITRAIIYHCTGNHEASMIALTQAYTLSNPNNLVIQYIEYGNQMRAVISAAKRDAQCKIPADWLDNIYSKSSTYAKRLAGVIQSYKADNVLANENFIILSKRESEILMCLSNGLTRTEIAQSTDLSINTVKSILQSVYKKLGASNSADAVRLAAAKRLI